MKGQIGEAILIVVGIVVILGLGLIMTVAGMYNGLVTKDVATENAWGEIEAQYQRRIDLIPNLVATVKGYAQHEKSTLEQVTALRAQVGNAKTPAQMEQAEQEMNTVISRLLVVIENYPELKANKNFLALQDELAGTENRIMTARHRYNNAVETYKVATRSFPSNIIANMFGFQQNKWEMFKAKPGAENAPTVDFT